MQHLFNNIVILCKPKAQTQNLVRSPNGGFIPPEGSGRHGHPRGTKPLPYAKPDPPAAAVLQISVFKDLCAKYAAIHLDDFRPTPSLRGGKPPFGKTTGFCDGACAARSRSAQNDNCFFGLGRRLKCFRVGLGYYSP